MEPGRGKKTDRLRECIRECRRLCWAAAAALTAAEGFGTLIGRPFAMGDGGPAIMWPLVSGLEYDVVICGAGRAPLAMLGRVLDCGRRLGARGEGGVVYADIERCLE